MLRPALLRTDDVEQQRDIVQRWLRVMLGIGTDADLELLTKYGLSEKKIIALRSSMFKGPQLAEVAEFFKNKEIFQAGQNIVLQTLSGAAATATVGAPQERPGNRPIEKDLEDARKIVNEFNERLPSALNEFGRSLDDATRKLQNFSDNLR